MFTQKARPPSQGKSHSSFVDSVPRNGRHIALLYSELGTSPKSLDQNAAIYRCARPQLVRQVAQLSLQSMSDLRTDHPDAYWALTSGLHVARTLILGWIIDRASHRTGFYEKSEDRWRLDQTEGPNGTATSYLAVFDGCVCRNKPHHARAHRRTGTFGLGGRWLSCPKNLRNSRKCVCWNRDTNTLKLHDKQNRSQFPHLLKCGRRFLWEFNFTNFGFFRFHGKNFREFGFQTLLVSIIFRGFHVQYLKVTKTEAIWSFLLHCLQPISSKLSNVKKRSKVLQDFCWREFVFTAFNYHRWMKNPRNLR